MIEYIEKNPLPDEYMNLRKAVGFKYITDERARIGLENSFYTVCAVDTDNGKTVGTARAVSDGGYTVYITDVMVFPNYQGKNIGKTMMKMVMAFLKSTLKSSDDQIAVYLAAAKGKEKFYHKFGFTERPTEGLGAGMSMWLDADSIFDSFE